LRYILLGILTILLVFALNAQDNDLIVSGIEITGDHKLDKDFLLARIKTQLRSTVSWEQLDEDQHRINRLNGVQHSVVEIDTMADGTVKLRYDVVGQKTIKPFIGLGLIKDNYWYKIGGAEYNLARKNQTLLGFYESQNGRPNGQIYFENPFFKGKDWGFWSSAFHNASVEPLFFESGAANYNYDLTGIGLGGINHIGLLDKLTYSITFFNEEYRKLTDNAEFMEGPDFLSQRKLLFSLGYLHDKVEYDFFYRKGYQHQILAQTVATIGEDLPFYSLSYEGRHYWKIKKKTNIAAQLRAAIGTNNDTPFAPYVLDSNFNLRGVGNRVDRATAQFVLNLEFRHTIFRNRLVAVQAVAFSDSGTWRPPGFPLNVLVKQQNFRSFVGGGFRFILTKVFDSVIRVDYGIEVFDSTQHGLVLGFGQFF